MATPTLHRKRAGGRRPKRRRRARRRARAPQITQRDLEILRWIALHGLVTAELVGRRFFWRGPGRDDYGRWAAYRRLRVLEELGLILSDKPYAHHPAVLRVTREGARLADVGVGPAPLVLSQLRHTLALVWLTEYLLAEYPGAELISEREIRAQRYRDLREGRREPGVGRTPDAVLLLPAEESGEPAVTTIAIELDLSRKDKRAMERMVREYDHEKVDRVWWFVTADRLRRVRDFVVAENADYRIEVRAWHG